MNVEIKYCVPLHALCGAWHYKVWFDNEPQFIVQPLQQEEKEDTYRRAEEMANLLAKASQDKVEAAERDVLAGMLAQKWEGHLDEEAVADAVLGILEDRACAINNGGLREQIEFLIGECGYIGADNTLKCYEVK